MNKVLTTCPYCGTGCNLYLHVEDEQLVGASPAAGNSVNNGSLCAKGHFGFDFVHHPDRLTSPLIRKNGVLVEADWDEALSLITARFKSHIQNFGPDSIAGFSSARCTNEENYLMQKYMRAAIGTNNIDHCARL
ncbi:MAG: spermidine/putrescine ABC transporter substrate-binding protein [Desulfovibrio sp. S3730MH75]|nr:MAG: spermidine/putrescine ABC transporter substrate-binding protein [Desulfovibrio sp. S3730MH75]